MSNTELTLIAENGNKKLYRLFPETSDDLTAEGATEEEVKESFPDYVPDGMDFYLYKYVIVENGYIHVKGPDGADISEDVYGKNVFDEEKD